MAEGSMAEGSCLAVVLAAGEGTRMRSALPKVMHPVAGLPMLGHVLAVARAAGSERLAVVVGPGAEAVRGFVAGFAPEASLHEQSERLGTAHAVLAARAALAGWSGDVLILYGDTPLVTAATLARLRAELAEGADVAVLGFETPEPHGYGRLIVAEGRLLAIREERDASEAERALTLCNAGIMGFRGETVLPILETIGNANSKSEYYLTDAVEIASESGRTVVAVRAALEEVQGVNNRAELAAAEAAWQRRARRQAMLAGVTMQAPETVFLAHDTRIGADVAIEPNVVFGPGVVLEDGATVKAFSHLEGARVAGGAVVGPFARLRPGTSVGKGARVGNFVEIKNAEIDAGAKINHLTYIGDASVGAAANVGAGTITCNYDGYGKHRTEIGAGAFIGSNSALVAPVRIGDGAYVGSGSVITRDVPPGALSIARGRQVDKEGFAEKLAEHYRARAKAAKEAKGGDGGGHG